MKVVSTVSASVLALGLLATPAAAQLSGLPTDFTPHGTGVTIKGTFGRGLNDNSGKQNSVGGMVVVGLPMIQIAAGASYFGIGGDFPVEEISFGGNAQYALPLPPATPVSVAIAAGVGYLSIGGASTIYVPAGAVLSIDVPSTAVAVTPWVSPQFRYHRLSNGVSVSSSSWGVSGGVSVGLPMGLGFHAMVDYDGDSEAMVVGVGAQFAISVPGLGGM
jgi:hypothetical protein